MQKIDFTANQCGDKYFITSCRRKYESGAADE